MKNLPSAWQLGDTVQVVFPDNGILKNCKIIKISFKERGEPLYDVEVPFLNSYTDSDEVSESKQSEKMAFFRIHDLRQWFLSYTQEDWDKLKLQEKQ